MWRSSLIVILMLLSRGSLSVLAQDDGSEWNKTKALKDMPFCALILREFRGEFYPGREIYLLMQPDDVTESNLRILFQALSEKYPRPVSLRIWVETDIEELKSLMTGFTLTGSRSHKESDRQKADRPPPTNVQRKENIKAHQWAYYKRANEEEFFSFNPDYPETGTKTVILRAR